MILSRDEIVRRITLGELAFSPKLDIFQLQQHSVDLRLGFTFMIPKVWEFTAVGRVALQTDHLVEDARKQQYHVIELEEGQIFDVLPGEFVAVTTLETIKLSHDLMGVLYPRSSVNRRGLSVDLTGIIDAGYEGKLLIPVTNNTKSQVIRMYPGERFCQVVFERIDNLAVTQESRWHKSDVIISMKGERSEQEMEYVRAGQIGLLKNRFLFEP
jgi:dCTP deaminase